MKTRLMRLLSEVREISPVELKMYFLNLIGGKIFKRHDGEYESTYGVPADLSKASGIPSDHIGTMVNTDISGGSATEKFQ